MAINIESLTLAELREIAKLACYLTPGASTGDVFPFKRDDVVCVITVTLWFVGRLAAYDAASIVLDDAAWVADTGRFSELFATGEACEVEPLPPGPFAIQRSAVIATKSFKATLRIVK
jgi:hypothetical protein